MPVRLKEGTSTSLTVQEQWHGEIFILSLGTLPLHDTDPFRALLALLMQ